MKSIRKSVFLVSAFILMLAFQNCGDVQFQDEQASKKALSSTDSESLGTDPDLLLVTDDDIKGDDDLSLEPDDVIEEDDDLPRDPDATVDVDTPVIDQVVSDNEACKEYFTKIDPTKYPVQDEARFHGIKDHVTTANAAFLKVSGISGAIAAKNIGKAKISGIHGSICLQAEEIQGISGIISGPKAHIALFGPSDRLGKAGQLSGIAGSDMVIADFEVQGISGIGRNLHVFGGRIDKISGIFSEIHLYDGATVGQINGINKGVFNHP